MFSASDYAVAAQGRTAASQLLLVRKLTLGCDCPRSYRGHVAVQ